MSDDLGNKQILAENLNYYMALNGKSRNDVCNALGFKYSTFCDWCNGKKYPRIDKIEMMANYFGVSKSALVERRDGNISAAIVSDHEDMEAEMIRVFRLVEDKETALKILKSLIK